MKPGLVRRILTTACGFALWLPLLQFGVDAVRPPPDQLADRLTTALTEPWQDGVANRIERDTNPEWDFMTRTFVVLTLANEVEANPNRRAEVVPVIDRILEDTLTREASEGVHHFLLPYGRSGEFRDPQARSIFVDGEIALMLAARELVANDGRFETELRTRTAAIVASMESGPMLSGESYPNECWTFCNTTALAALAVADAALGEDHSGLSKRWVALAKRDLVDPTNGLLVSSYDWDGRHLDGPEGSSVWMSAHNLLLVDPEFARDQFDRAREQLAHSALGFGWSNEWPANAPTGIDVDSGPVVPLLGASPGASGMAILGAAAFGDDNMRDDLLRSLELAAFPIDHAGQTTYAAAGTIGSAVVAYSLRFGPLWARVQARAKGAA